MLKDNIAKALNKQVNMELYSAYLYLSMSAYCDSKGFKGVANWLNVQAQEELAHGMHMYEFILERGASPVLPEIQAPPTTFVDFLDIFMQTYTHEQLVTESINLISTLAMQENDHATYQFLQWYIKEQIEEESSAELIVQKLRLIGDNVGLIFQLDAEMQARTFVNPFPVTVN